MNREFLIRKKSEQLASIEQHKFIYGATQKNAEILRDTGGNG